jgi:uncharacterized protein YaeQ
MALQATIHNFDVELADTDRGVYESLALRLARHPSESEEYLIARLLAYLLEYQEGIAFSRGVSDPDEPAIAIRDLTGTIATWIDIGAPDAARLHKASKAASRVVVYTHKDPQQFLNRLAGEKIHRAERLELYAIDRALVSALVDRLDRRVAFSVSISDRALFVAIGPDNLTGAVVRLHRDDRGDRLRRSCLSGRRFGSGRRFLFGDEDLRDDAHVRFPPVSAVDCPV